MVKQFNRWEKQALIASFGIGMSLGKLFLDAVVLAPGSWWFPAVPVVLVFWLACSLDQAEAERQ